MGVWYCTTITGSSSGDTGPGCSAIVLLVEEKEDRMQAHVQWVIIFQSEYYYHLTVVDGLTSDFSFSSLSLLAILTTLKL